VVRSIAAVLRWIITAAVHPPHSQRVAPHSQQIEHPTQSVRSSDDARHSLHVDGVDREQEHCYPCS